MTFNWDEFSHDVTNVESEADFTNCIKKNENGYKGPYNITFPPIDQDGFQESVGVYHIVCPVWDHCFWGMKIKIIVTENCPQNSSSIN